MLKIKRKTCLVFAITIFFLIYTREIILANSQLHQQKNLVQLKNLYSEDEEAALYWPDMKLSDIAGGVQFYYRLVKPAEGSELQIRINNTIVGVLPLSIVNSDNFELSPHFDIPEYAGQTVKMELHLRSQGEYPVEVLIKDFTIVMQPQISDITVPWINYAPGIYSPGGDFITNVNIKNQGVFPLLSSQQFSIKIYLSLDKTLNGSAILLREYIYENFLLPEGKEQIINLKGQIPTATPLGAYYLFVVVDEEKLIRELNENNNTNVSATANIVVRMVSDIQPPKITPFPNRIIHKGEFFQFFVTATDPNSDPLTLSATLSDGSPVSNINATFTDNPLYIQNKNNTASFLWTPTDVHVGQDYTIIFQAENSSGLYDTDEVVLTVIQFKEFYK